MADQIKNLRIGVEVAPVVRASSFNEKIREQLSEQEYGIAVSINPQETATAIQKSWSAVRGSLDAKNLRVPIDIDWSTSSNIISQRLQEAVATGIKTGLESFTQTDFGKFEKMMHKIASAQAEVNKQSVKVPSSETKSSSGTNTAKTTKANVNNLTTSLTNLEKKFDELKSKIETNGLIVLEQQMRDLASSATRTADALGESYVKYGDILQKAKEISKIKAPALQVAPFNATNEAKEGAVGKKVDSSKKSVESVLHAPLNNLAQAVEHLQSSITTTFGSGVSISNINDLANAVKSGDSDKPILTDSQVSSLSSHLETILSPINEFKSALHPLQSVIERLSAFASRDVDNNQDVKSEVLSKLSGNVDTLSGALNTFSEAIRGFSPESLNATTDESSNGELEAFVARCNEITGKVETLLQTLSAKPVLNDAQVNSLTTEIVAMLKPIGGLEQAAKNLDNANSKKSTKASSESGINKKVDRLSSVIRHLGNTVERLKNSVLQLKIDSVSVTNTDDIRPDFSSLNQALTDIKAVIPSIPNTIGADLSCNTVVVGNIASMVTALNNIENILQNRTIKTSGSSNPPSPQQRAVRDNRAYLNKRRSELDKQIGRLGNKTIVDMDQIADPNERSLREAAIAQARQAVEGLLTQYRNQQTLITSTQQDAMEGAIAQLRTLVDAVSTETRGGYKKSHTKNVTNAHRTTNSQVVSVRDEIDDALDFAERNNISNTYTQLLESVKQDLDVLSADELSAFHNLIDSTGHVANTTMSARDAFDDAQTALLDSIQLAREAIDTFQDSADYKNAPRYTPDEQAQRAHARSDQSFTSSIKNKMEREKQALSDKTQIDFSQIADPAEQNALRDRINKAEEQLVQKLEEAYRVQGELPQAIQDSLNELLNKYIRTLDVAKQKTTGGFEKSTDNARSINKESAAAKTKADQVKENLQKERNRLAEMGASDDDLRTLDATLKRLTDSTNELDAAQKKLVQNDQIVDSTKKTAREYREAHVKLAELTDSTETYLKLLEKKAPIAFKDALDYINKAESPDTLYSKDLNLTTLAGEMKTLIGDRENYYGFSIEEMERLVDLTARFKNGSVDIRRTMSDTAAGSAKAAGKLSDLQHKIKEYLAANTRIKRDPALYNSLMQLYDAAGAADAEFTPLNAEFKDLQKRIQSAGLESDTLYVKMKKLFLTHFSSGIAVEAVQWLRRGLTEVYQSVKLVDDQMTELKKVTDLSDTGYKEYLQSAAAQAKELGASLDAVVESTATWARLGYTIGEAQDLSRAATVYINVADGLEDATEGTETLISTMKAFEIETSDAMDVVDALNEVGNKYSISASGIGQALMRSSSGLAAANNDLSESIALIVAGIFMPEYTVMCI